MLVHELGPIVNRTLEDLKLGLTHIPQTVPPSTQPMLFPYGFISTPATTVIGMQHTKEQEPVLNKKEGDVVPVISMKTNETALQGFRRLHRFAYGDLSAIPILNEQGELVGNLSASDARRVGVDEIPNLLLPVLDYVKLHQYAPSSRTSHTFLMCVTPQHSLGDVINMCVQNQVHRCWIIHPRAQKQVIGVISLTDIIRVLCDYTQ